MKPRRPAPAAQLRALARDVRRLRPDWRMPERYFENRDEIENRLRRLARDLDEGTKERGAHDDS